MPSGLSCPEGSKTRDLRPACCVLVTLALFALAAGCSKPRDSYDAPSLPQFSPFTVAFSPEVSAQYGVDKAQFHIGIINVVFDGMNTILASAEGPVRSGLSFVWKADVGDGSLVINADAALKGYDWALVASGTLEVIPGSGGYYENFKVIDGRTNLYQTDFSFNIYDTAEVAPVASIDYSKASGINTQVKIYGYNLLGISVETKFDIAQNPNGTGHVIGYWDASHVWPDSSKYLELYWRDAGSGTAEHGSWETRVQHELSITASSGAW